MRFFQLAMTCAVLLALGAPSFVQAGEPKRDPEAYEKTLKSIESLLVKGKCKSCRTKLDRLLVAHKGAAYVYAGLPALEDLVRRIAFATEYPPKDPQSVVSGKIESYRRDTGAIKLTYTPKTSKDWERDGGLFMHPATFSGPYTIEIKGSRYPVDSKDAPIVLVGYEEGGDSDELQSWTITAGSPPRTVGMNEVWLPASIKHFDGDVQKVLFEREISPAKAGGSYTLVVKVKRSSIEAKLNGKSIGRVKKEKGLYGSVSFSAKGWGTVKLQGQMEPSWIQGMLDKLSEQDREAFRASFDAEEHLPEWVYEEPEEPDVGEREVLPEWPTHIRDEDRDDYSLVYALLRYGQAHEALDKIEELSKTDFPKAPLAFLRGYAQLALYRLPAACKELSACIAADREFGRAKLLHGIATRLRGDAKGAAAELKAVFAAYEPDETVYRCLSSVMLLQGRLAAVRAIIKTGREHGVKSDELDLFAKVLLKAEKGPDWSRSYEYKTGSYHVVTDMSKEMARESGQMLESMFRLYQTSFDYVKRDTTRRFKVYIFSGQSGFLWYVGDLSRLWGLGGEKAAGLYSPVLKQLLIWNLPSEDELFRTVRHEGFHQYLDRVLPNAPTWLDEGLAVYYEYTENDSGKLKPGQVARDYVALLHEKDALPLKEFFALKPAQFYERGHLSYAQAWSIVHLMRNGDRKYRKLFKDLVGALENGSAAKAMASVMTDDVIDSLEVAVEMHLMDLGKD